MESRVIEAAKRVFVRKGYEATKMGDIALEVGISRYGHALLFPDERDAFRCDFRPVDGCVVAQYRGDCK